jgi:DNA-binding CsgD family transcriptional regulator
MIGSDGAGAGPPCFVRRPEMERLSALVRHTVAGHGSAVVIDGEPGIGKTVLLDTLAGECARLGVRVLRGGAEALERRLPFAVVDAFLSTRAPDEPGDEDRAAPVAALLRAAGEFGQSAAGDREFAVTEAVLDLMDRWCVRGPVALLIDDAQWVDPASAVVLHRLGRDVSQQPLLMVLAGTSMQRSETAHGLVRSLVARGARSVTLEPLSEAAVVSLVEACLRVRPGPALRELVARASGNPMYVTELLAALAREGAIRTVDGVAELTAGPGSTGWSMSASLVEAIQRRLAFLPRKVRATLAIAAVLGPTVDLTELTAVLDMSVAALADVLGEAMAAGLLVDTGRRLAFRHELIREALARYQPESVQAVLHLRAGQFLAAAGAPVQRVAEHLLAGRLLDPPSITWLIRAAEALTVRAPDLAVPLLRRALAATSGPAVEELHYHLVRALLWAGALAEAEQTAQLALAAAPEPAREGALRWLLVQARYRQGRVGDVLTTIEEALASPLRSTTLVGRFHGLAALCLVLLERFDEAEAAARQAIAAGTAEGDPVAVGYGWHIQALRHLLLADVPAALPLVDRALAAFGAEAPELDIDPYVLRAECLLLLDRLGEADDALVTAVRHNQRAGSMHLTKDYVTRARLRFLDGRWDDALTEIRTGLEVPDPYHFGLALPATAALIEVHRRSRSRTPGGTGAPHDSVGERAAGYLQRWAQALAQEAGGYPQHALDLLYPVWARPTALQPRRLTVDICLDLARLAATVGDRDRARQLAETTRELAAREDSSSLDGTALLCEGLADGDPEALLAAAAAFGKAGRPLAEAYGYEEAAALLAGRGETSRARTALDDALAIYATLDAAWDIARATARLRQAGVRRGRRGGLAKRPLHGWAALTDTETKIALLVAEGLSNPDIGTQMYLSPRTVQTHISHILGKLQLKSRVELAVDATRNLLD